MLEERLQDHQLADEVGRDLARLFDIEGLTQNMLWFNGGPREYAYVAQRVAKLLDFHLPQN